MFHKNRALVIVAVGGGFVLSLGLVAAACSNSGSTTSPTTEPGTVWPGIGTIEDDAGHKLTPLPIPNPTGANTIYVTASGEAAAVTGWPFPPQSTEGDWSNYTWAVDGWQFVIQKYIVNVANITLWSDPNTSASNQSLHGPAVAQIQGPFVIDLHNMNVPNVITGQGGTPELAVPIGVFTTQNLNGNASFDPTATYGFGFSTVAASYTSGPNNVNLSQDEQADFDEMVANGYSVLYVGTATWNGSQSPYGCQQTNAGAGASAPVADGGADEAGTPSDVDGGAGYDFTKLPQTFTFRFGFSTPTNYVNCQNFTAQGMGIGNEPNPRGVQISTSQSVIAQVTVHMDHPFWESFVEDTPVHLDQIAAQYVGVDASIPQAHTEEMKGVPPNAFTDHLGTPLPWHNCSGSNYTPLGNGQMFFYTKGIPIDPTGTCVQGNCTVIRDYYDFMRYTQSTQGHLNSQGLCYVDRQYPSPSGNSASQ
jgi:hypothetical protein